MTDTVMGVFASQDDANRAVDELKDEGYRPQDISIIMKEAGGEGEVVGTTGEDVVRGTTGGAVTGGVIGGIAGLLIGVGAIAIPGIGALLIGGPIAAALGLTGAAAATVSGAVTGALAGGLVGALVSLGVPREEAEVYEQRIREGAVLVAVPAKEEKEDEARDILERHGADQVRIIKAK